MPLLPKSTTRKEIGNWTIALQNGQTLEAVGSEFSWAEYPGLKVTCFQWVCVCGTALDSADLSPNPVTGGAIYQCPHCPMHYSVMGHGTFWKLVGGAVPTPKE